MALPIQFPKRGTLMKRHLPVRLVVCAALVGTASLATVAGFGSVAGATGPLGLTCTKTVGTESSQNVSGCTGSAAIAGEAGAPPAKGVQVAEGAVPGGSGDVVTQVSFTGAKVAIFQIKETALTGTKTKPIPTKDCAATHAGTPKETVAAYVTFTGTVVKSATVHPTKTTTKTYTTTATKMIGGATKGADCVYESGSGKTLKIYVYNKGNFTL